MLTSQVSVADAHSPGPMVLDYDAETDVLTVTVTHSTADVNSHYIYEIVIEKNSVQVDIQTYSSQSDSTQIVETFTIDAVDGDVLEATAKCSVSGQITEDITVEIPSTTTSSTTDTSTDTTTSTSSTTTTSNGGGTTDPSMMPLLIATAIIAIGIVLVIVVLVKRR
jgi:hypothetical protein